MSKPGTFKATIRDRILKEMLGGVKGNDNEWNVLIMDEITVKIVSSACSMSDIMDEGISLVEDIHLQRQPQPALAAVYFITPQHRSVGRLIEDFMGKEPMYRAAHVFFSSQLSKVGMDHIKQSPGLTSRLASFKETNLEFTMVESQTFTTCTPQALEVIYGKGGGAQPGGAPLPGIGEEVGKISARLATLFMSLGEWPAIRYRSPKSVAGTNGMMSGAAERVPYQVAAGVNDRLTRLRRASPGALPATDTCDLLVVDRGIDTVAPVIHEWTYEAMLHDLLEVSDNNVYRYQVETNAGKRESKEVILSEVDPVFAELRHLHIAEASIRLKTRLNEFQETNKAAKARKGAGSADMSTRDIRGLVQSLPQYREQLGKLAMHTDIAHSLLEKVGALALDKIGAVEQDIVMGDANSKDILKMPELQTMSSVDKLRLLMCYAATHTGKLDATRRMQWLRVLELSAEEFSAVLNLELLGVPVTKKGDRKSFLSFGGKKDRATRKERPGMTDQDYALARFTPLLADAAEGVATRQLSEEEFPFLAKPEGTGGASGSGKAGAKSARTKSSWARRGKDDAPDAVGLGDVSLQQAKGRRLVVFVVGGTTRSEMRVMHKLSESLGREVILGSTTVDTPMQFLGKLMTLGGGIEGMDDVDL